MYRVGGEREGGAVEERQPNVYNYNPTGVVYLELRTLMLTTGVNSSLTLDKHHII